MRNDSSGRRNAPRAETLARLSEREISGNCKDRLCWTGAIKRRPVAALVYLPREIQQKNSTLIQQIRPVLFWNSYKTQGKTFFWSQLKDLTSEQELRAPQQHEPRFDLHIIHKYNWNQVHLKQQVGSWFLRTESIHEDLYHRQYSLLFNVSRDASCSKFVFFKHIWSVHLYQSVTQAKAYCFAKGYPSRDFTNMWL